MVKIKSFDEKIDIKNKKIILRSDFNVPIFNGSIQDKTRINLSIPFIQSLLKKEAKVWVTQKNTEVDVRQDPKKEEQEKEINVNKPN